LRRVISLFAAGFSVIRRKKIKERILVCDFIASRSSNIAAVVVVAESKHELISI
jgi:hypothetical protein